MSRSHGESLRSSGIGYFAYTGWIVALTIALWYVNWIRLGERGWMLTWQLIGAGFLTALLAIAAIWRWNHPEPGRLSTFGGYIGSAVFALVAIAIVIIDHRGFVLAIASFEAAALIALRPQSSRLEKIVIGAVALISWSFAGGMTYTSIGDWLLNGSPTTGLAVLAFVASFMLVAVEFADDGSIASGGVGRSLAAAALLLFAAFALRSDHLIDEWFLIHRSYFADVAEFVRHGHWLLWDVPSGYGLLSIATIAMLPASNSYQALFELEAAFLIGQGYITFAILRWGRTGWVNAAFSLLFPLAVLFDDNIARFPWGPREYQQGGLRFFFVVCLLFIAFLRYVWRDRPRRTRALLWAGHVIWVISLFWSIEDGLFATGTWLPYLLLDGLTDPGLSTGVGAMARRVVSRFWPLPVLAVSAFGAIEWYYRARLGTTPDWRGYVEFAGLFTSGQVRLVFWVQKLGPAWCAVLALGAIGSVGIAALRQRRFAIVPLLGIAWSATWVTTSYFAVEPIDSYIYLLMAVYAPAAGIAFFASRSELRGDATALVARLSFFPIAVIIIAHLFGESSRLAGAQFPFTRGWSFNVGEDIPVISGEPAALLARAGLKPGDPLVIKQGGYWTELDQGLIMPFARGSDGTIAEYRAWIPVSPIGPQEIFKGLSKARQAVYMDRFLDRTHSGGWYLAYRDPARCEDWSARLATERTLHSINFSLSYCAYRSMRKRDS